MINHNIEVIALLSGAALGDLDWLNLYLVVFGDSRGLGAGLLPVAGALRCRRTRRFLSRELLRIWPRITNKYRKYILKCLARMQHFFRILSLTADNIKSFALKATVF